MPPPLLPFPFPTTNPQQNSRDMADRFPDAQVTGTDLSPVAPSMQPANISFEVDDCCSPWVYPRDHFDLIHIRGLFGSIADWPTLYRECFAHLAPGGYLEQMDWSVHIHSADAAPLHANSTLARWGAHFVDVGERVGKTFEIAENMASLIADAGFEGVVERRFPWPIGPWSSDPRLKDLGRWNLLNWEEGMEGWVMASYTRVLGWSYAQVQDWLALVRGALRDRTQHVFHEVYVISHFQSNLPPSVCDRAHRA